MWDDDINEFVEKDPEDEDVLYLKSDIVCEDEEATSDKPLDTTYVCWSKEYGSELVSLSVHPSFPAVACVAVGSCDDTCKVVDFATGGGSEPSETILGPFGETVSCCSYSPNGNHLALGLMDGNIMMYVTGNEGYKLITTLNGSPDGIEWLSWDNGSSSIMFGGSGHTVFIWSHQTQTTACINTTDISTCGKFCSYGDITLAVLGCNDGHLNAVRYERGSIGSIHDISLGNEMVTSLDCHDSVQLCIAGLYCGSIFLVELSKFQIVASFTDHEDTVESVQFCKGSQSAMAVSCGHDGKVIMWDCCRMLKLSVANLSEHLTRMTWIPSKSMVAVSSVNGDLYTLKNGKTIKKNRPHRSTIQDLAALPCEENDVALISVSEDGIMAM